MAVAFIPAEEGSGSGTPTSPATVAALPRAWGDVITEHGVKGADEVHPSFFLI
jgi:hypothetical protein